VGWLENKPNGNPGTDVMIFIIFSPKNLEKKCRF
jgi:hypothetical protein